MRTFCVTLLLLLGTVEPKLDLRKVIIFEHSGNTDSILRPLVICTENIYVPLSQYDIEDLHRIKGESKLTLQEKQHFSDVINNRVVTDKSTFSVIGKFVLSHNDYYANNSTRKDIPGTQSFEIVYNGKVYMVYSKLSHKYLNDLKAYLILCHSDPKIMAQISDFRY